jgi:NAD(P)-dependent dehydrogenase (short-subunit alcohol dehydrogenase family)
MLVLPVLPSNRPWLRAVEGRTLAGMTTTFITGANKSLGYETARRLIAAGHAVIIGARDRERGRAAAEKLGARWVQIDVSSDESVARAALDVSEHEGAIDVLINNAGIPGPHKSADELTGADALDVLNTNVASIVRVTHAFLPLLRKSKAPRIINVSSGLGSFAATHDSARVESKVVLPLYSASKSAVTMLSTQYAKALKDVRVNAVDPGYTATDFNNHSGPQTITEGTDAIFVLATEPDSAGTGRFIDRHGTVQW